MVYDIPLHFLANAFLCKAIVGNKWILSIIEKIFLMHYLSYCESIIMVVLCIIFNNHQNWILQFSNPTKTQHNNNLRLAIVSHFCSPRILYCLDRDWLNIVNIWTQSLVFLFLNFRKVKIILFYIFPQISVKGVAR